jgi:hypothetical protein
MPHPHPRSDDASSARESPGRLLRHAAGPAELREIDTAGPDGPPTAGALSRRLTGGSTTAHRRSSQASSVRLVGAVQIHASACRSALVPDPAGGRASRRAGDRA